MVCSILRDVTVAHASHLAQEMPKLHRWFQQAARQMPWRETDDPYAIWVSEAMLQQTQVATVIPYYQRWMRTFPTVTALARASEREVLLRWEGLGYYSRARNLHRAAKYIVTKLDGEIPRDPAIFQELPGVGSYTTAAVMSIAFGLQLATVDGNVRRVISRLLTLPGTLAQRSFVGAIDDIARELLGQHDSGQHNQAMMELGALICTPKQPKCSSCPLTVSCLAYAHGKTADFPEKAIKRPVPHHHLAVAVVKNRSRLLLEQRPAEGLLARLWDFPQVRISSANHVLTAVPKLLQQRFNVRAEALELSESVRHVYSHLKVTLHPVVCTIADWPKRASEPRAWRWVYPRDLKNYAISGAGKKVLQSCQSKSAT